MKEFIKKVPTSSIILTIFAVVLVIWGIQQLSVTKSGAIFKDAVNVESSEYNNENEGGYICVNGKVNVNKAPVDSLTGITADGVILKRVVEMYQYTISDSDTVVKEYLPYQEQNIEGKSGESYENPLFPEDLTSAVIVSDASVGEYKLGNQFLSALETAENTYISKGCVFVDYEGELPEFENNHGIKSAEGCYTNQKSDTPEIGDLRIVYQYMPKENLPEIAFFGVQKDGFIGAEGEGYMSDTMKTAEEMKEGIYGDFSNAGKGMFLLALIFEGIAVFGYFRKNKKEGGAV